jgi:hypothetical protein
MQTNIVRNDNVEKKNLKAIGTVEDEYNGSDNEQMNWSLTTDSDDESDDVTEDLEGYSTENDFAVINL